MNDDSDDPPPYRDPPNLYATHLLTCRSIWYDNRRPEAGFGLAGIFTHVEPPDGVSFPIRVPMFVYVQLWGDEGEYRLRIRVVRIDTTEDDDEVEVQLGTDGEPREFPLPRPGLVEITGLNYVDEFAFPIGPILFREPGVYEYQLWADGIDEPIGRERVLARE